MSAHERSVGRHISGFGTLVLLAGLMSLFGCGGSGGTPGTGGGGVTTVNNVQQIQVTPGPANNDVDAVFTTVTVCMPGGSTCQNIPDVLVDTGSSGLRILASQLTLSLPPVNDASGNQLGNCAQFADSSFAWGPVVSADVQMTEEKASAVPIQIIGATNFPAVPADCNTGGVAADTVAALGANGILGVGVFRQDCGPACGGGTPPKTYFRCPGSTCAVVSVSVQNQLQNPVWLFPQDNNGVLISLPSVPIGGLSAITGSMVFGIGTQSDNALGTAQVYTTQADGTFSTSFNGKTYPGSVLDSGSNGLFFLDSATISLPDCTGRNIGFYCPASTVNFTATNIGSNGVQAPVAFSISNADLLLASPNSVFSDLGGGNSGKFDWGLPFYFGRKVFTAIESQTTPAGPGPYWAY